MLCAKNRFRRRRCARLHHVVVRTRRSRKLTVSKCLPPDIQLSDVVEAKQDGEAVDVVTVAQKLIELRATCNSAKKLVDGDGREIVFYRLKGCWGNPPDNYDEILQQQRVELEQLKKERTVIEMTCNPSGLAIP